MTRHWRTGPARALCNGPMFFRAYDGSLTAAERHWLAVMCRASRQTKAGRLAIRRAWARCGRAIGVSGREMAAEYRAAYRRQGRESVLVYDPSEGRWRYANPRCPKRRFVAQFNDDDGRLIVGATEKRLAQGGSVHPGPMV